MPMVPSNPRVVRGANNNELMGQAAADFGTAIINSVVEKRLNADRTIIEQRIREAPTYQDALDIIDQAPFKVKNQFRPELEERAKQRFPEQEILQVLDPEGGVHRITQEKGRPLTDEQIRSQGYQPATQHVIVSTDRETGQIEIHDVALGMQAAGEDLERIKATTPGRDFQIAQGPEIETFMKIRDQQLDAARTGAAYRTARPSVAEIQMYANIEAEMANDPLVGENGAIVLESHRDTIDTRFKDFNGKFEAGVFSLDNPETAPLVQNGISISSQLVGRGYNLEKAIDVGFNAQIAGSVITNLMKGNRLDNGVSRETLVRFGVTPQVLMESMDKVQSDPKFAAMQEYDPKSPSPDIGYIQAGPVRLKFIKVNGKLVPFGKE